jgi:hypothetical protein
MAHNKMCLVGKIVYLKTTISCGKKLDKNTRCENFLQTDLPIE